MKNICSLIALILALVACRSAGEAQQRKVYRIGYLSGGLGLGPNEEAFRQGLRELGYVEGQNIVIEWRHAKGKLDHLPELGADLAHLNVDCIFAVGVESTRAAKQATSTIPVVMGDADDDPVRKGLVESIARPGGNVTGFISISSDLAGKRLELLKEVVPKASRVAMLHVAQSRAGRATSERPRLLHAGWVLNSNLWLCEVPKMSRLRFKRRLNAEQRR